MPYQPKWKPAYAAELRAKANADKLAEAEAVKKSAEEDRQLAAADARLRKRMAESKEADSYLKNQRVPTKETTNAAAQYAEANPDYGQQAFDIAEGDAHSDPVLVKLQQQYRNVTDQTRGYGLTAKQQDKQSALLAKIEEHLSKAAAGTAILGLGEQAKSATPEEAQSEARRQFLPDLLRNAGSAIADTVKVAAGLPEAALTMATGLTDQAGTGLGVGAGMLASKLRGEPADLNAAADIAREGQGTTWQPKTSAGQRATESVGAAFEPVGEAMNWAGEQSAEKTGSPLIGAAILAGLNVADPAMLEANAARLAALKGVRESTPKGPTFRSAVDEAIGQAQPMGTIQQYVAMLRNKPGIKGEELADLRVDEIASLPDKKVSKEQFQQIIDSYRPDMQHDVLGYTPEYRAATADLKNAVNDVLDDAIANPQVWKDLQIGYYHGPHPFANNANAQRRTVLDLSEEARSAITQYTLVNERTPIEQDLINTYLGKTDFSGPQEVAYRRYEIGKELYFALAVQTNRIIAAAAKDPQAWNRYNLTDAIGKSYNDFNLSPSSDEIAKLKSEIMDNENAMDGIRTAAIDNVPASSATTLLNSEKYKPSYPNLRYFRENPEAADYRELVERQKALPGSPDTRNYSEPHFPRDQNLPSTVAADANNITWHSRIEDAKTPEGNPATFINELQSAYARDLHSRGSTADPLHVRTVKEGADALRKRLAEAVKNNDAEFLNNEISQSVHHDIAVLQNRMSTAPDQATSEKILEKGLAGIRDNELLSDLGNWVPEEQFLPDLAYYQRPGARSQPWDALTTTRGNTPSGTPELLAKTADLYKTPFVNDRRVSPRAGTKSWRLRALKTILRDAVDKGHSDVYLSTGDMIPRIEDWVPEDATQRNWTLLPEEADILNARAAEQHGDDLVANGMLSNKFRQIMQNYDMRLPAEWGKYLKQFDARLEPDTVLPITPDPKREYGKAQRIKITPKLLAEVLRGQKLYQIGGGAALLGLLAQQEDQSNKDNQL